MSGTVTDAKAFGKFAGGAVLEVRLDSITLNGADLPVQAALRTFSAKGKGKRTAILAAVALLSAESSAVSPAAAKAPRSDWRPAVALVPAAPLSPETKTSFCPPNPPSPSSSRNRSN